LTGQIILSRMRPAGVGLFGSVVIGTGGEGCESPGSQKSGRGVRLAKGKAGGNDLPKNREGLSDGPVSGSSGEEPFQFALRTLAVVRIEKDVERLDAKAVTYHEKFVDFDLSSASEYSLQFFDTDSLVRTPLNVRDDRTVCDPIGLHVPEFVQDGAQSGFARSEHWFRHVAIPQKSVRGPVGIMAHRTRRTRSRSPEFVP